ncbi:MAG: non-homologous end-joining DNA ligase [Candidatus Promineifilaceae bacterium]|nr:non-homologous end-joining DNA ligase [Candidatus Promineifilaceae bacterium]
MSKTIEVDGQEITLSNLDKLFYPDEAITKGDVIDYYHRIAPVMVPHMTERPLNMQRFPDGIEGYGFYQKEVPDYFPDWISRVDVEVKEDNTHQTQVVCDRAATLVYLADQACLTPHIWLSRSHHLHRPDRLVFDLDPPEGSDDFDPLRQAARRLHELLAQLGLPPYLMTTGSQGLHVVAPLEEQDSFDAVRDFCRDLADLLARRAPEELTTAPRKEKREGRLFLDYLRNAYGQTTVTPYALRPLPGAPVATPLDWDELDQRDLNPQSYRLDNIFRRLGQKDDPWATMAEQARSLEEPQKQLRQLMEEADAA